MERSVFVIHDELHFAWLLKEPFLKCLLSCNIPRATVIHIVNSRAVNCYLRPVQPLFLGHSEYGFQLKKQTNAVTHCFCT